MMRAATRTKYYIDADGAQPRVCYRDVLRARWRTSTSSLFGKALDGLGGRRKAVALMTARGPSVLQVRKRCRMSYQNT